MGYYKVTQVKMPLAHNKEDLDRMVGNLYNLPKNTVIDINKKSVDARKKHQIMIVYNLEIHVKENHHKKLSKFKYFNMKPVYEQPVLKVDCPDRPVIIGSGPAGLFAALILAEAGAKPIIIEQGKDVESRHQDVNQFFESGELNVMSNIQFGEGGAGTYSDGKINTGVKDKFYRIDKIVETFIKAGAPEEIRYISKPHIGTDYLINVVKNIRERIIELGGDVRFSTQMTRIKVEQGVISEIELNNNQWLKTSHLILAIGHSSRDTFKMLVEEAIPMEKKAFAVGLRIEHPQAMISESQYGPEYDHPNLPVADYKLTYRTSKDRGVYTFCMCPGGFVVNAASEEGRVVCNGMSNFARDEQNANSAVLVNIHPDDFEQDDLLAGVAFQRKWEEKAFELAGSNYNLPIQTFKDYQKGVVTESCGNVTPNIKGKYTYADLNESLPPFVSEAIKEGVVAFGRRIKGFDDPNAILTGVETRSSSPVRITRGQDFMSEVQGLYPCGEGAGYAGGIMSAALDGIKVAEALVKRMNQE